MVKKLTEAANFIRGRIIDQPLIGMITGTGLGNLTDVMEIDRKIPYKQIPHFPKSTVESHAGILVSGTVAEKSILAMQGRFHIYEGYTAKEITFPIRVMAHLGVKYLFVVSAAGGLNPLFKPGEVMLVTDHINLTGNNPLIGKNIDELGPRFPDMTSAYDKDLIGLSKEKAREEKIILNQGIYVGITGPSLETPAETRFLRLIGGDAVGMSTVNEVIAAVHCGLKVLVIVAITNSNLPDCMTATSMEEVIFNAKKASSSLTKLLPVIIKDLEK
jgi:purine-nucleoside phosphorylase